MGISPGIISLLTDFGSKDVYVGQMKAVIAQLNPSAKVIDLSHDVSPQDVVEAAFLLAGSWRFFPDGTVHIAVVDPGVGSERKIIAAEAGRQYFIAPDNGLLDIVLEDAKAGSARNSGKFRVFSVENPACRLYEASATFHGRDVMAPAAAHLTRGTDMERLGPPLKNPVKLNVPRPAYNGRTGITGEVVFVDGFGNLITNIVKTEIEKRFGSKPEKTLNFEIADEKISGLCATYSDGKPGRPMALIGSMGYLEIAVNLGNAAERLSTGKGDRVRIY
ncbi:MAG: SAM hydrolase/SAM-dependent halogenase family protein [Planctomycetota bacterium]|jgi:S-adenosylmethionine hydrolase